MLKETRLPDPLGGDGQAQQGLSCIRSPTCRQRGPSLDRVSPNIPKRRGCTPRDK